MDDLATRFADFLEELATKIRSLTVDRFARGIRLALAGTVAGTLAIIAFVYLVVSVFRAVAVPLTVEGAYLAFGGLFVLAGVLVWLKRNPKDGND